MKIVYRILLLEIIGCLVASHANAATWYTASTGDISGNIWASTTNGSPGAISPALADGDVLYIDDDIRIDGNFNTWGSINITIYLNSTLTFGSGGQLHLGDGSVIVFQSSSAMIVSEGGGASNKINFGGGTSEWNGNDPPLTGPGTLNTNSNGALPVELISLSVKTALNNSCDVSWSTASQLNFSHFEVEHSVNAQDWNVLTSIGGEGTTNELMEYSYTQLTPQNGKNYYRLRMVDLDETFEYSDVVSATVSIDNVMSLSPNPTSGRSTRYTLNFTPSEGDQIVMYDLMGAVVLTNDVISFSEDFVLPSSLVKGTYLVHYKGRNVNQVQRLVLE